MGYFPVPLLFPADSTGIGGGSAPLPVPAGASAFGRASPAQGLCGSGRLECGQHSRCSPPTDARRRTEAAFLRRGLAPRARRSLQELPCFPLRGVSAGKSQTTAVPSCEASALPLWASHAVGSTRGWEGRRECSAFCSCTQHPTHPWILKEQIQLLQSTQYPRSEPPPRGWEVFPSPRQVQSAKQPGPPYPGLSEMPYQRFPATASLRGGEGPPAKSAQLPPQPARQKGRQHPRQTPPSSPHPTTLSPRATVRCPGLRLPSSSSSPSLQRGAGSSHSLALISHV